MRIVKSQGVVVAIATFALLSACSSSSTNDPQGSDATPTAPGTTASATTGASSAVDAARASVAKAAAEQPPLEVPALSGPAPKQFKLAVLTCVVPVCQTATDKSKEAGKRLGWNVFESQYQLTPASYVSSWNAALLQKPDAIIYVAAFPKDLIKDQLAEAVKRHLPLIAASYNAPTLEASGTTYAVSGAPELEESGRLMGDVIAADAGGPSDVVFVQDPILTNTLTPVRRGVTGILDTVGIKMENLDVSLAGVGKTVPGQVVNYLQRHPETKYIVLSLADLGAGVPQALAAVGLTDKVKIVTRAPQAGDLAQIKDGKLFAGIAEETSASGFRAVDAVIRLALGGQPVDPDPAGWHQIFTKDNVTQTSAAPPTPGVPDVFYTAWGLK